MVSDMTAMKSIGSTALLLVGVVLVVGGLMALYSALGFSVTLTAFGSLFLLYWAGIQHRRWSDFLPSVIGGLTGIAMAWTLLTAPEQWGSTGAFIAFAILAVVLFFYLRGQGALLVNNASMLLLLVATIPEMHVSVTAPKMAASLLIGALWIGIIAWLADLVRRRIARVGPKYQHHRPL